METDRRFEFAFSSGRSGSGPATWGQSAIWDVVRNLGTDAARYNVSGGSPLAPAVPVSRIAEVVRELLLLNDSMRTKLRVDGTGRLEQTVYASGAVPVFSRRSSLDEVLPNAYALYHELQAMPFDWESEWPVRIGIIESGNLAHYIIFSLPHTASDGTGLRNLLAAFTTILNGGPAKEADRLQPLEEAAFQVSERGRRRDAAARRSWREKLETGPLSQFPAHAGQPPAEKFPNAVLNSPALGLAMDQIAAAFEVSGSSLLLAAAAATAHRITGVRDAVYQVVVNNRFLPGLADGVNTVAQEGLFHLPNTDEDFPGLIRRTFGSWLSTQRHAYYDKLALDRDIAALRAGGGPVADYTCIVNDTRGLMPILGFAKPSPEPLAEARSRTTLSWPIEFEPRRNTTFALGAQDAAGSMELAMTADSALIPRSDMEQFLRGIEELVINQALAIPESHAAHRVS